ncbi:hypothetical protein [Paraclostridium sordellii]|uniref:hypothetical protein n=1 Tax=Paraclostridium sordellii TaxID=1505 RepID=UPI0005DD6C83|nr:hypothetical protein [Paeniclostridium sordellii]CEN81005.1 Uncharacterised protein [[Clostridium] sordellii] [Paeniclostridium sordellii]
MGNTSRKNIFELMQEKYDLEEEIMKIEDLMSEYMITTYEFGEDLGEMYELNEYILEAFVSEYLLHKWKNCRNFISCSEIRTALGINEFIQSCKLRYFTGNLEEIINYIEYILNIVNIYETHKEEDTLNAKSNRLYDTLIRIVNILLDHINYESKKFESEEKVLVVEKNPAATSVAEIVEDDLSFKVIEYNHHLLKGNLDRKKEILKALADKVEPLTENLDNQLASDFGFLVNNINIRHNNLEGKNRKEYIVNMQNEELEEWYDEAYQLMLLCILENEYKNNNQDKIKQLRKDIKK